MKAFFLSLGCDKTLVDMEHLLGRLAESDLTITDREEEAEVIVVNTCCFIDAAKEESIQAILEMAEHRKHGACRALIVAGCMAERYREEIFTEIPEVDAIVGTNSFESIAEILPTVGDGQRRAAFRPLDLAPEPNDRRVLTTGGHYAYLKIAEGCDKHCTYCVIPSIRGPYRSVPQEELLREATTLAEGGVKELILVAQETTRYGLDLYGEKRLPMLLSALCRIPGLSWIRMLYCYPEEIDAELLEVMASEEKVCSYLDLPIQHVSDRVLARMGRKTTGEALRKIIGEIRARVPDVALRTTLISGFPGETEEDHAELLAFVREMRFDRLGVFAYSREEGTPAYDMPEQIEEAIKERRREELLLTQQEISRKRGEAQVGREIEVLIEGLLPEEGVQVGRSRADAPDVDGEVFLEGAESLQTGEIVRARITGASEYDLIGEVCT